MSTPAEKAKRIVKGAAALAAAIEVERNLEHHETDRVSLFGVPVWLRDEKGNPKLLGVPFRRWIRGPRR